MSERGLGSYGEVECLTCGKEWEAVWEMGCKPLQCPYCGNNDTVREVWGTDPEAVIEEAYICH